MTRKLRLFGFIFVAFVALFALVACAPANGDKAKEKMEKAGYSAVWTARSEVGENGEVGTLTALKGQSIGGLIDGALGGNGLTATLYDTSAHAKAVFNDSKNAEGKSNYTLVGKWVVWGPEEAVKAFKK